MLLWYRLAIKFTASRVRAMLWLKGGLLKSIDEEALREWKLKEYVPIHIYMYMLFCQHDTNPSVHMGTIAWTEYSDIILAYYFLFISFCLNLMSWIGDSL